MSRTTIKQHDVSDCGAACIASIAAHYKLRLPVAKLRQFTATDRKGANVTGLIQAMNKLGFETHGVKGSMESLNKITLPAIAHLSLENGLLHYVVIYQVKKDYIKIMDPADGRMHHMPWENFERKWTGVLVLAMPTSDFRQGNQKMSVFRRFAYLLKPHRSNMIQVLVGSLIYTILGLSVSIFLQKIIDNVIPEGNIGLLNLMGIVMLVILACQYLISHTKTIMTIHVGQQIDARLILGYYKHLFHLPQTFFDSMRTGEIISRINDATKIRLFINDVLISFGVNIFILIFSFLLMFTYYWKLAVIMLIVIPAYVGLYFISDKLHKRTQRRLMENAAELESQLVESINAAATVKRFGLETYVSTKTESRFIKFLNAVYRSGINMLWIGNSNALINGLQVLALLWVGANFVINKHITPGELLSFYAIIGYFSGPVANLIGMNKVLQDALIASDRLFDVMDLEQEDQGEDKFELTPDKIGDIHFKAVTFAYGSRPPLFKELDLQFRKGKMTAVVGESGSGKTTLLSLIQRIYTIQQGTISIGQYDIRYLSSASLRKVVGVVPQQVDIFATSLLENISIGDTEPDIARVTAICTSLGMDSFIEKLPDGLYSLLGENGQNLSGGQRQRLAIARALYRQPEILILDEATSMLDSFSERCIQEALATFLEQGKTIIQIAHRMSTVRQADEILVMEEGALKESGTHKDLIAKRGLYYRLWDQQANG